MPTSSKKELQQEIQDLKDALESEFTPAQFKDDIRKQIKDSEAELDKLEKAEKEVKTTSAEKKPEKIEKKETAAQRVKKRVEQAKKTVKTAKKKQEEVKQEKKSALQKIKERKEKRAAAKKPIRKTAPKKTSLSKKRDAERKALKAGRRVSADGNVYYENRSNRADIQRRKYPYLEDGGFTNDGAGMFAKGGTISRKGAYTGRIVDTEDGTFMIGNISGYRSSGEPVYDTHKFGDLRKDMREKVGELGNNKIKELLRRKYADGGTTDFTNDGAGMFEKGGKIEFPIFYVNTYTERSSKKVINLLKEYGIIIDSSKKWHTKGYGIEKGLSDNWNESQYVFDIRDSSNPKELIQKLEIIDAKSNLIFVSSMKTYADGGTTDFTNDGAGMFAGGGEIRMYNFLKDDLQKLENAVKGNDKQEIDRFFSYWTGSGGHLKSLKTEENERMWNFMLGDLKELEEDIKEGDKEDIDKFFSYWNTHLETLKYAKGGIFGSDRNLSRDRMFKSQEDWEQRYKRKTRPKNPAYQKHEMGGELHKTEFAEGGVIVDYTEGLLADPRFDINSPMFARGGKLSNKYNYLPKYKIATITTEDGAVIDGNDIIDGVYVKKKVKF